MKDMQKYIGIIINTNDGYTVETYSDSYPNMVEFWDTMREYALLPNRVVTVKVA